MEGTKLELTRRFLKRRSLILRSKAARAKRVRQLAERERDAKSLEEGDLFDRVSEQIEDLQMGLPPVKYVVQIAVDSVWDMSAGPNAGERLSQRPGSGT